MKPRLLPGTILHPPEEYANGTTEYYIENPDGDLFEVSGRLYRELALADGCHKLPILQSNRALLRKLKEERIITTSRFELFGLLNGFVLIPFGDLSERTTSGCRAFNRILPLLSLTLFLLGIFVLYKFPFHGSSEFSIPIYIGMLIMLLAAHEFGHFVSAAAYHAKLRSAGILLFLVLPIGGYVSYETENCSLTTRQNVQIALSGIEMNLLMAGCMMIAAPLYPLFYRTVISAANASIFMAAFNLLPSGPFDGEAALSALFGVESISRVAKRVFRDPDAVRTLRSSGPAGLVCLGTFGLTYLAKIIVILTSVGTLAFDIYVFLL